ncbi:hypothetical protein X946_2079 [Burkholderia sp. ABCPW 111]|nr:hypothetical protein X946_2079 [Burkholderia sp. ABCPW 111]
MSYLNNIGRKTADLEEFVSFIHKHYGATARQ